ncbi:FAD-binding protein [Neosynechococcus sphagnicola]|uniref:FAD-binding protein n=1 Tax=Neosynechococcus sphagnicola TaxID=1501145 RepID=UPI000AF897E1
MVDSRGHRFAFDYHPSGELAPRDVVSRAIYSHLQTFAHRYPDHPAHVWLDLRPLPPETLHHRFPNILRVCQQWGIDVTQQRIPVAPAAHYWMGGITTDLVGQTSIPGLYAVGETASTGVHGANRLASNSLLECLVFGMQMAELPLGREGCKIPALSNPLRPALQLPPNLLTLPQIHAIHSLRQQLPQLIWQGAGICRQLLDLQRAIAQVTDWRQSFAAFPLSQFLASLPPGVSWELPADPEPAASLRYWGETQNLLDIADGILQSALFRTESRGSHYRLDYPHTQTSWQVHTLVQGDRLWQSAPIPQ